MTAAVLALPGLWAGLTFAAACVAGSVWLRPAERVPHKAWIAHEARTVHKMERRA
jgi:hypothetical protein